MERIQGIQAIQWATEELGHAALGDVRRTRRLVSMASSVLMRPGGSVGAVFDNLAELHGAYDFVENDAVDPRAILAAMGVAAATRATKYPFVYVATDGTAITLTDRTRSKETGRIGTNAYKARGDKIHSALVIDPEGIPLGLCAQCQWQRPRAKAKNRNRRRTEEKETHHWLDARATVREVFEAQAPRVQLHFLHDREADAWPILLDAVEAKAGEFTTIRAKWDRRLVAAEEDPTADPPTRYLREALAASAVLGTYELQVSAGPKRTRRTAIMEVRACKVTLDLKDKKTDRHHDAPLDVVCTHEVSPVPKGEKPIEWLLLTTRPVETFADATQVIDAYRFRWTMEPFHLAWKSAGTDVEATQLEAADHRARWELILAAVAVTLLRWQLLAQKHPNKAAETEFTETQIEAVRDIQTQNEVPERGPVTMGQMVRAIAFLGGWTGSKHRPPGTKILVRGWGEVTAYLRGVQRREKRHASATKPAQIGGG
jgi:hypothetical protein